MQFWPRKRAARLTARVRTWATSKDAKPLGFAAYKVGMTHIVINDTRANSMTKGEELPMPVTVLECPPMKVIGVNAYKHAYGGTQLANLILAPSLDKYIARAFPIPKNYSKSLDGIKHEHAADIRLLVATQPHLIGLKKTPEIIELSIGGAKVEDKLNYAKTVLGKEIAISDVFAEGAQLDVHSTTTGRGSQGPVPRFGVDIRSHKSQKTIRGPGSLGGWGSNRSWSVAHMGQHGLHRRTEINKWLVKIGSNPAEVQVKGGFKRYGVVKATYALLKGSVGGPSKRCLTLTQPIRPNHKIPKQAPQITYISTMSKQ